jgi:NAD(P)-dependent dehydrogenase (short-subunit alcohol dehydrogenase family)
MVLGPSDQAGPAARPMFRRGALPSVRNMNETKNAVITGASRGLGLALARGLAAEGWSLVIDARDAGPLHAAAASLSGSARVIPLPGDITDPAHRAALRDAADRLGGPDLLINNAGTLGASPLPAIADYPIAELREAFEVNVLAPLALTQLLLPALRRRAVRHLGRRRRALRRLGRLRRGQGGAGAGEPRAGSRGERGQGLVGGSG